MASQSEIEIGDLVELLPGKEGVYEHAIAGARGKVADKKEEEGFPMVFVEWDKDHWLYTGEPDCWTFQSHFQPTDQEAKILGEQLLEQVFARVDKDHDQETAEKFTTKLQSVLNILKDSEGFIIVSANSVEDDGDEILVPVITTGFTRDEVMVVLEAQLIQMAAMAHQEMALTLLSKLEEDEEQDDRE